MQPREWIKPHASLFPVLQYFYWEVFKSSLKEEKLYEDTHRYESQKGL